jgi:hypothetical protein
MKTADRWQALTVPEGVYFLRGGERVALFRPEQQILDEVRLYPGSDYILGGIGACGGHWLTWGRFNGWRPLKDQRHTVEATARSVRLHTRALDATDEDALYEADLTLSFDRGRGTYVYDVVTTLTVPPGKALRWAPYGDLFEGLEFCNLFPSGIFNDYGASPVEDLGRVGLRGWAHQERYRAWVYQDARGQWAILPLNHFVSSPSFARKICPNSRWILVGESDRAPTLEFLDDTWQRAHFGICHALYDMHFNLLPEQNPLPAGTVLRAHYRLTNTPRPKAEAIWRRAKDVPIPDDERRATDFIASTWSGLDTFTEGVHHGCYDPHRFWQPFVHGDRVGLPVWRDPLILHNHEAMQRYRTPLSDRLRFGWSPTCADRRGGFAWVESDEPNAAGWGICGGSALPYTGDRPYRVSAWVRGRGVRGEGIAIGVKPWSLKETFWSRRVKTESGWERVEVVTPPIPPVIIRHSIPPGLVFESNRLDLLFELRGTGRAEVAEVRYGSVRP